MANPLTAERLRALFYYDPVTGQFSRLVTAGGQVPGPVRSKPDKLGYLNIAVDRKIYKAHRLAWLYLFGVWPSRDIDHIDGVPSHNWIANLREATESQNKINEKRRKDNTSGFKGAKPHGTKWQARIKIYGVRKSLGYYDTPEEAHEAYMSAARHYYGAFARAS